MTLQELISSNSCAVAVSFGGHGSIFVNHLAGEIHLHNVGKTMSETTHDWEWFMPPIFGDLEDIYIYVHVHINHLSEVRN